MNSPSSAASLPFPINPSRTGRWLAGGAALAGSVVAAGSASAEIVQIDLVGNEVNLTGATLDDQTYRDLTGDGNPDLINSSGLGFSAKSSGRLFGSVASVRVGALFSTSSSSFIVFIGKQGDDGDGPVSLRAFVPLTFTDASINGGAPTSGFVEVLAKNNAEDSHTIQLVRLVFDDENAAAPGADVNSQYRAFYDASIAYNVAPKPKPKPTSKAAKNRLKNRIAALEAQIAQLKATAKPNAPRLNFYRMTSEKVRQIAALERQLAALRRSLGRL